MSSLSEGLPLTVIEAAMSGRPTVVTDVGGMAEAAGRGGLVVPPGDPAAFAAACVAPADPHGRAAELAAAGRADALAHFTLDRFLADVRERLRGERGATLTRRRTPSHRRGAPGPDGLPSLVAARHDRQRAEPPSREHGARRTRSRRRWTRSRRRWCWRAQGVNDRVARDVFGVADVARAGRAR